MIRHINVFFCFIPSLLLSQEILVDSLKASLASLDQQSPKYVDVLNDLSFEYIKSSPAEATYYINQAINTSKEINYQKGLIRATTNKGNGYWVIGLQDEALSYYLLALSYEVEDHPYEYIRLNNNIAEVFKKKQLLDSAEKYYDRALNALKIRLPDVKPVILLSNIAETFFMKENYDSAYHYYQLCLKNSMIQENKRGLAYSYAGLADIAFLRSNVRRAKELQTSSLEMRREIQDTRGVIQSNIQLGTYESFQTNYVSALDYWDQSEEMAIKYKALDLLNEIYEIKYNHFYERQDYKSAADYINQFQVLTDSIQSQEFIGNLNRIKNSLLSEIQVAENMLLRKEQEQERSSNRSRMFILLGGFLLVSSFGLFMYQRKKRIKLKSESEKEDTFNKSLLNLAKIADQRQSDFDDFISQLLEASSTLLDCQRASYWSYDKKKKQMSCLKLLLDKELVEVPEALKKSEDPQFFEELLRNRTIAINDIENADFFDSPNRFLKEVGLKSLLCSPLFMDDEFIGFISFSSINKLRKWKFSEQRYVASIADIIVSAFANHQSKILEKQKESLIDKLRIRNQSLREFNSVISHNLREPLTQIISLADLLDHSIKDKTEEAKQLLSTLSKASEKIDKSIKDLSTVLNEKDPTSKDFKRTFVSSIVKEVLEQLNGEIKKVNPKIVESLSVKEFTTYRPFLFDIFYHTISNSIKFHRPDQRPEIEIITENLDNKVMIRIKDNGRGLDLEIAEGKIFKMYQKFHLDVEGRGMGLYLVKNRVISLGGEIEVLSKVGEGAEFRITLPKKGI